MESSRSPDPAPPSSERRRAGARFTPDALARVLTETLALTARDPLYVAYSGGMDSHVLLHALALLRARDGWALHALHIDHGLQPRSSAWAEHCARVCAALGVPYRSERVSVRDIAVRGLEDAARRARYAALARLLPAGAVLLTAQHRDDQAETVLLQLLRGAGPAGLAGMPASARFGGGRIARPLLDFPRAALAAYAAAQALQWVEDASNLDTALARNFLRARVWPVLHERWPQAAQRFAAAARHQAEATGLLDEIGRADAAACADGAAGLRAAALCALSPARRVNALRAWLRARGVSMPSEAVLRQIVARVVQTPQTRHAAVRIGNVELRRYRDRLVLIDAVAAAHADWEASWEPPSALDLPGGAWRLRAEPSVGTGLSRRLLAGRRLRVRLRRGGERCRLRGHHRKVKKLLQEAGIPPWERATLPFVYADDELAAIGDRWVCEPFAARDGEPGLALILERTRISTAEDAEGEAGDSRTT